MPIDEQSPQELESHTDLPVEPIVETNQKGGGGNGLGIFVLCLLVMILAAVVAGAAYKGWQLYEDVQHKQSQWDQSFDHFQDEISGLKQKQQDNGAKINLIEQNNDQAQQTLNKMKSSVVDVRDQARSMAEKFASITGTNRNDLLIAEIEHYLKLANQRIQLTHDVVGAAKLLRHSIDVAKSLEVPGVISFRQTLIADRNTLEQIANIDVEGIFLELSVINQNVEKLRPAALTWSFENDSEFEQEPGQEPGQAVQSDTEVDLEDQYAVNKQPEEEPAWQNIWQQWKEFFSNHLVRVHRVDQPEIALLRPDDQVYLQQNLHLLIAQGQLAVMRGEGRNFKVTLMQAESWIKKYYDPNSSVTLQILETLKALQDINIEPELPNIDASMQAIRSIRESWLQEKVDSHLGLKHEADSTVIANTYDLKASGATDWLGGSE